VFIPGRVADKIVAVDQIGHFVVRSCVSLDHNFTDKHSRITLLCERI
jgi:hypothetical protein